jgi:chromosome segregation ATPase
MMDLGGRMFDRIWQFFADPRRRLRDEISRLHAENILLGKQRDIAQAASLDWHRGAGRIGDRVRNLIQERNNLQKEIVGLREEITTLGKELTRLKDELAELKELEQVVRHVT